MRRSRMAGMILAASVLAGCSTTGPFGREKLALPVGPSYVGGRGTQMFPTSANLISNVKDGMSDVGIHSIVQNEDPSRVIILEGTTTDNRKARVTVQTSGANATVSAKIAWLGDEPLTRAMLDRIAMRQGTMPPQPSPTGEPAAEEASGDKPKSQRIFSRDAVSDATMLRDQIDAGIMPAPHN